MTKRMIALLGAVVLACSMFAVACNEEKESVFTVSPEALELTLGETFPLTAKNYEGEINWRSSDESVATVSDGTVTAVGFGETSIFAIADNGQAVCAVTVSENFVPDYALSLSAEDVRLYRGDEFKLFPTVHYGSGTAEAKIVWISSDEAVVTVSEGTVTAVGEGDAVVTASAEIGGRQLTAECAFSVIFETSIEILNDSLDFTTDMKGAALEISASYKDGGNTVQLSAEDLAFASADETVATVDERGALAFHKSGETEIIVSYGKNCSREIAVTVYEKVSSAADLAAIAHNDAGYYLLMNDIDFSGITFATLPSFSGVLNGNGYALKNINLVCSSTMQLGTAIFDVLSGTVKNISVTGVKVTNAGGMVGNTGLIARSFSGRLENVYLSAEMRGVVALAFSWADYRTWGLHAGFVASSVNGGTAEGVIFDVVCDAGTDICLLGGVGVLSVTDCYAVKKDAFPALGLSDSEVVIAPAGEICTMAAETLDGEIWDFSGGAIAMKNGCTL